MAEVFGFVLVFLGNLSGIDFRTWIASLAAFMTFIFFGGLGLRLTCINRQKVVGFSLVFVFNPILILLTDFVFFFLANSL